MAKKLIPLPKKKYQLIYADPPWQYNYTAKKNDENITGCAEQHYPTMTTEDIKKLPIDKLSEKDSILLLWATFPQLKDALEVIEAWGFEYKIVGFTWVKLSESGKIAWGCGFYTRSNAEVCLLARKGKGIKRKRKDIHQIITARRNKHSSKPHKTYTKIEELFGDVSRLELFARTRREGWDAWGNEVPKFTQKLLK
jgi:N6-adenosine-specific RNA methylase IME4